MKKLGASLLAWMILLVLLILWIMLYPPVVE